MHWYFRSWNDVYEAIRSNFYFALKDSLNMHTYTAPQPIYVISNRIWKIPESSILSDKALVRSLLYKLLQVSFRAHFTLEKKLLSWDAYLLQAKTSGSVLFTTRSKQNIFSMASICHWRLTQKAADVVPELGREKLSPLKENKLTHCHSSSSPTVHLYLQFCTYK